MSLKIDLNQLGLRIADEAMFSVMEFLCLPLDMNATSWVPLGADAAPVKTIDEVEDAADLRKAVDWLKARGLIEITTTDEGWQVLDVLRRPGEDEG